MEGHRVGYIRVSTIDQSTARQLVGIELGRVFEDKASGKTRERPALIEMLAYVRSGDEVFIHSMDRLARNLRELLDLVTQMTSKGIRVHFMKEGLTLNGDDSPMAKLMMQMMGAFAEFERSLIHERQKEGIAIAKAEGVYKGRKPKLSPAQEAEIKQLAQTRITRTQLAERFTISRGTLYKVLGEAG